MCGKGTSLRGNRILIVDDYQPFLEGLREWLVTAGYHVETATTRLQALAKVKETQFAVAVIDLDLSFPKPAWLTGSMFIQRMLALDPGVHLIGFTVEEENTYRAIKAKFGTFVVIPKPVQPSTLKGCIEQLISKISPEKIFSK